MTDRQQFDAWWASHRQGGGTERPFAWLVWQAARTQSHQTEAMAEEPVGEVYRYGKDSHGRPWHGIHWYDAKVDVPSGTKLYTAPVPQRQEPVAWMAQFINRSGKPDVYVTTHKYLAIENDDNGDPKPLVFGAAPVAQQARADLEAEVKRLREALIACLEKGKRWHPCDPVVVKANAALERKP